MEKSIILIDVGSANGIYPIFHDIKKDNKNTIIYTFDPEKEGFNNNLSSNNINYNIGLYNKKDNLKLYITNKKECSSILKPNMNILNNFYNSNRFKINKEEYISVERLDNIIKQSYIDIIKLDTQGSEYEILEGCGNLLENTKIIICETEFIELYEKQKIFTDLCNFLKNNFIFLKFERLVYFSKDIPYDISNMKKCVNIENETITLCKKLNLHDLIEKVIIKFNLIKLLIKKDINNIKNFYKLINIEKEIKALIPENIRKNNEKLLNCELVFSDSIFINNKLNYDKFDKYI